jgi:hypothetical protein
MPRKASFAIALLSRALIFRGCFATIPSSN